jgi:hypothetical protein
VTAESVERALHEALEWLRPRDVPERVIADCTVRDRASVEEGQGEAARRWVQRILDQQDAAGSWAGSLVDTASALLTIRELRRAADLRELDPGVGRGLAWIVERRGAPGAWTDGCSPERHQRGLCHHFAAGFFSPAAPEVPLPPARLPTGVVADGETEIRFVSSVVALRCLLEWQDPGTDARLHLEALRRVVDLWSDDPPDGLTVSSLLAALRALLLSPAEEDRAAARRGLRVVAGKQRGDGSWVDTEPFQALDLVAAADEAGLDPERTRRSLWHGARLLVATQHADGSWGGDAVARRVLIGCRALRRVDLPPPA